MTIHTWPDGTIRSNANAFSVLYEVRPVPVLSAEDAKRLYNRNKKREQYARQAAARVNRDTRVDAPNQADKDRTAAIDGRYAFHGSDR